MNRVLEETFGILKGKEKRTSQQMKDDFREEEWVAEQRLNRQFASERKNMKQVILVRMDLKMEKGKLAVQCAHASVEAVLKTNREKVNEWQHDGAKKVTLKVESLKELQKYQREADDIGLKTALITDAGKTFFTKPTTTCLALGPDDEEKIDRVTGKLKML